MSTYDKFYCTVECPHMTCFTVEWGVLVLLVLLYRGVSANDKFYCRRFLHKGNGPKAVNATLEIRRCSVLMETNRVFHSFVKVSHCAGIILALMGRRKKEFIFRELFPYVSITNKIPSQ